MKNKECETMDIFMIRSRRSRRRYRSRKLHLRIFQMTGLPNYGLEKMFSFLQKTKENAVYETAVLKSLREYIKEMRSNYDL